MKKLISMTDFVLEQEKLLNTYPNHDKGALFERCGIYANFLKKPLELWQFVPCDEDGNVLEEPECSLDKECASPTCVKYQQAKERCLFEGFEVTINDKDLKRIYLKDTIYITFSEEIIVLQARYKSSKTINTIEDLVKYNLEITPTAEFAIGFA